jgi:hypothetical protein
VEELVYEEYEEVVFEEPPDTLPPVLVLLGDAVQEVFQLEE